MGEKLPKEFLFMLRNSIEIEALITGYLRLEYKISENAFRFLCPLCKEFKTGIHKKTNLARCFFCQKNFNCIDLTMVAEKVSFLEAVSILSPLLLKHGK